MRKPSPLGEDLKNARLAAGVTQGELAKELGVSQPLIAKWEKGTRGVPRERLSAVTDWIHRQVLKGAEDVRYGPLLIELSQLSRQNPEGAHIVLFEAVRVLKQGRRV